MVILPLGLVSKTKSLPIVTLTLTVVTCFFSILNFPVGEKGQDIYWHSDNRQDYALGAKNYVRDHCDRTQARSYCTDLEGIPLKAYLLGENIAKLKNTGVKGEKLFPYILSELEPENLQKENPELYQKQLLAQQDLDDFVADNKLLSHKSISLTTTFRSLFLHGGYLHLIGNLLILIFLALPVEERMGSLFFGITYLASGLFGSGLHVLLYDNSFYLVGASSAVSGIAGALTFFFWRNHARVLVSFFFIFTQTLVIPVFIYTPVFLLASDLVGTLDPLTNTAHLAHIGGFFMGLLFAWGHNLLLPLPRHFTYPFELNFYEKLQGSLSQTDRIQVLRRWLYYTPLNLYAFKGFVTEAARSDLNPQVNSEIDFFKKNQFPELYLVNKRKTTFLKILPVDWLSAAPIGDDPAALKKLATQFEEERDFQSAFKVNFLILNEVGWSDWPACLELYKNYKRSSRDKGFMKSVEKLKDVHAPFRSLMTKRIEANVQPA